MAMAILALCMPGAMAGHVEAQSGERCFPETQQCIRGPIRAYWERNGDLAIFGYPITPQHMEDVEGSLVMLQWFERDRLEDHGAIGVLAGRLGARFLELNNRPWEYFKTVDAAATGCQYFAITRHSLCEPYLSYWRKNGGLERFGYPITQPIYESVEQGKFAVQYFERRRMEIHPELPASPILLGLLGRDVQVQAPSIRHYPDCLNDALPGLHNVDIGKPLGCPMLTPIVGVNASTQQLERGLMIWTDSRNVPGRLKPGIPDIFALIGSGPELRSYTDTWTAGTDADMPALTPPGPNLYTPWRGFGKVWLSDASLHDAIGWATEPQAQQRTADIQLFDTGLVLRINETGIVYIFGNTNTPTNAQIVSP